MRWVLMLLAALSVVGYACSSEDKVEPEERAAAELVNAHLRDAPKSYIAPGTMINLDKHKSDCTIGEGSTTRVEPMAAKCEWIARQEGADTRVDLVEKWKCSEFNERAGRQDFCQKDEGSHRWSWVVSDQKEVAYLEDTGDAAPESFYLPTN